MQANAPITTNYENQNSYLKACTTKTCQIEKLFKVSKDNNNKTFYIDGMKLHKYNLPLKN